MFLRRRFYAETLPFVAVLLLVLLSFQYYLVTLLRDLKVRELHDTTLDPRDRLRMMQHYDISPEMLFRRTGRNHSHLFIVNHTKDDLLNVIRDVSSMPSYQIETFDKFSLQCEVIRTNTAFNIKNSSFPFRIYVYDLPAELNVDLARCVNGKQPCFDTSYCGNGQRLGNDSDLHIYSTWQFSLEVIIHHKMLLSAHRTFDPNEADVFYVPYYGALACFCHSAQQNTSNIIDNIEKLHAFLDKSQYFRSGKPHLLTISKIEREEAAATCPLLRIMDGANIRYIGIEQESNSGYRARFLKYNHPMIVAPYPSYGHLHATGSGEYERNLFNKERNIQMFLAASTRRSNTFRARILDQVGAAKTYDGLRQYFIKRGLPANSHREIIWLVTPECLGDHDKYTMEYMKNSIFCLQPPGDSPTRKSFYDALISGCIPVHFQHKDPVVFPFEKHIPYDSFTVKLSQSYVTQGNSILEHLKNISKSQILEMQQNIQTFVKYFQYSHPPSNYPHKDAFEMILKEVREDFNL